MITIQESARLIREAYKIGFGDGKAEAGQGVTDEMVEAAAKELCRFGGSGTLDDAIARMEQWPRFKPEARAALEAALAVRGKG